MRVNEVYEGDCLGVMKGLPDNCIDTIVTDPPYSLSSIKKRFSKTSINDANQTGFNAKNGTTPHARLSAGFMGKEWDNEIAFNPEVWREALRIAKPGAYLMAFGGTRTYHRLACAIEDAGWEIRDCVTYLNDGSQAEAALMASLNDEQLAAYLELHYPAEQIAWVYGQGMGLGHDVSKGIDKSKGAEREVVGEMKITGQGLGQTKGFKGNYDGEQEYKREWNITAPATPLAAKFSGFRSRLKPAFEPVVVAMKPIDTNYATNAERWGLAGLDIDGCRVETGETLETGRNGRNKKSTFQASEISKGKAKFHTQGRYPANIIHDGSDQVEAEFAKAGVSVSKEGWRNNNNQGHEGWGNGTLRSGPLYSGHNDTGTPSRFFATCPPDIPRFIYQAKASPAERGAANNHPTVKPLSLIRELVKLTRPPDGGIVLDPFAGSGTTALAAIAEGRDYILIEKEPEYCEIIRQRIAEYTGEEIAPKEVEVKGETVKQMPLW